MSYVSYRKQRSAFDQVSEFDRERIELYRDCGLSFRGKILGEPTPLVTKREKRQVGTRWRQAKPTMEARKYSGIRRMRNENRECTMRYDRSLRHTSSVRCLKTFRSIFAVTLPLVRSNSWDAQLVVPNNTRYA
ncbi:hypothetical protein TNCV_3649691 [Trichonephila clavipes]|nr:hypothetical protein TNCV_3649691 [Trichonephila clavipes]